MEIWDGYFIDGTLANQDLIRGEEIPKGLYHIVCDVLVRHIDGDYLLMQRDFYKSNYGGYYEATAGGSALKGEDILACAKRELFEETGIVSDSFELIGQHTSSDTIYYSFLCVTDCDKTQAIIQLSGINEIVLATKMKFLNVLCVRNDDGLTNNL